MLLGKVNRTCARELLSDNSSLLVLSCVTRRPVRNTGLNPSTSEWKVPETPNFNAAFLELSRSKNCLRYVPITTTVVIIHRLPSLVIIRSWNQFLRYSTLQVYHCAIVNVHALPALGPDQANIN
ncbi:hypothetical protein HOLleu_30943 [Holothuria leucospilota]|uniref:Uncharacterized protein n=1 Tax=Holothuria leucospilota TaxID=206669 RepID=A0A9Q1BL66_HOLLE|nr:hypothetical protein HOLleu_30943 [Holothuria leucospilota]